MTVLTRTCAFSVFWARWIQSRPSQLTSWRSILIVSSRLCLGPASDFCIHFLIPIHSICPTHLILIWFITQLFTEDHGAAHYAVFFSCLLVPFCIRFFYRQFCLESHTLWTLSIILHWMLKIICGMMVEVLKVRCFKFGVLSWEFFRIALLLFSPVSISLVLLHPLSCACTVGHLRLQYQFIHSPESFNTKLNQSTLNVTMNVILIYYCHVCVLDLGDM